MMSSCNIQLYDSILVHRRSQCILHAEASATLSRAASSAQIPNGSGSSLAPFFWIPKARSFTFSLRLGFHEEICYVDSSGKPAAEVIANYLGRAEVCQLLILFTRF